MTGDLVAFLDSDDVFHQDMIQTMTDILLRNRADIIVCRTSECWTTGNLYFPAKDDKHENIRLFTSDEALRALIDGELSQSMWSKLYAKHLWNGFRFPDGCVYEDIRVTYRLIEKAGRIVRIDDILVCHRHRPGSITATFSVNNIQDWFAAVNNLEKFVEDHVPEIFTQEQKKRFYERNLRSACLKCCLSKSTASSKDCEFLTDFRAELLNKGRLYEGHFITLKSGVVYYLFKYCPFLLPSVWAVYQFGKHLLGKNIT